MAELVRLERMDGGELWVVVANPAADSGGEWEPSNRSHEALRVARTTTENPVDGF